MEINNRFKQLNPLYIFSIIFLIVGILLMLTSASLFYNAFKFNLNSKKVEGTISNIVEHKDKNGKIYKDILVDYNIDNIEYKNISINSYNKEYLKNNKIQLYYNVNEPNTARNRLKPISIALFLAILGSTLVVASTLAYKRIRSRENLINKLINKGNKVSAIIKKIEVNNSVHVNTKNPFLITCECEYNGVLHKLYSDYIWEEIDSSYIGHNIDVYFNNDNFIEYFIDIRDLLKK